MKQLISGSASQHLRSQLCQLGEYSCSKTILSKFPNQELKVRVDTTDEDAILLQSFSNPVNSNIIEYLLLADAIKRSGVKHITSVIPWFGYSKQDKVFRKGEPLSAKVIAKIIQAVKVDSLITLDLHNESIAGYFDIPVHNISATSLFIDHARNHVADDWIVISPDMGSMKKSTKFARELNIDVAFLNKSRDLDTGEVSFHGLSQNIDGKSVMMLDDMIATGSTMVKASEYLKVKGAKHISIYATHHLYIPGVQALLDQAPIDNLIVTDSIQKPDEVESEYMSTLSIAPLIHEALI